MKKTILLLLVYLSTLIVHADEGMWIPLFIKYNEADMQRLGMQLSAEDIYSNDAVSLKDAIVRFGRGCTGMLISPEGLMMTNHHCGYSQIQALSSLENDYLKEGFWAQSREEELANPGLTVTFLVRMEEVTEKALESVTEDMTQRDRARRIEANNTLLVKEAVEGTHYEAGVKSFFNDNRFFLMVYEVFEDIRLVGAPPTSIGKFGGDTDNWMWPRHTGDFALYRIYADKDNKPAPYAEDNVPYQPRKHFPVSISGVRKGDFTFVYGFPGRTNQYATSYEVEQIKRIENPISIKMRDMRLDIIGNTMREDDLVRIKYAAKQASIANGWKKWIGENRGLKRLNTIENKKKQQEAFTSWANSDPERQARYAGLFPVYETIYQERQPAVKAFRYLLEAGFGAESIRYAYSFYSLLTLSQNKYHTEDELNNLIEDLKTAAKRHFRNYDFETDKKLFQHTIKAYYKTFEKGGAPAALEDGLKRRRINHDFEKYAAFIYDNSIFTKEERVEDFLNSYRARRSRQIERDPVFNLAKDMYAQYFSDVYPLLIKHNNTLDSLNRILMQGLKEWQPERHFYPDANMTLRVTYGNVSSYYPRDAVKYDYFTTIDGIFEKETLGYEDYEVHPKLRELYKANSYGIYGKEETLPVCFIAKNHTTGGNSGSPVINAHGHLVGMNFDRNWEGTMSDIHYDPEQCRNISVDVRYILFIIENFAGASHLLEEMDIIH